VAVPRAFLLSIPLLALTAGCVIGRPARPSQSESAQGPSSPPVTGSPIVPQNGASPEDEDAPPAKAKPDAIWVHGYWHWDGVRYVWTRGRWEDASFGAPSSESAK
jgi:hypothetical protein